MDQKATKMITMLIVMSSPAAAGWGNRKRGGGSMGISEEVWKNDPLKQKW